MKRHEVFPSRFLCAVDLDGDTVVQITGERMETLQKPDGQSEDKLLLSFAQIGKQLVLNVTNWDSIQELHGDDSAAWVGKWITLYVDPNVRFGAKKMEGIRVRPEVPGAPPPNHEPAAEAEEPPF